MENGNPRLKAAFLDVVDNQIVNKEPPETRQTLERLISEGISEEDARTYIAQAVCVEMWDVMKNQKTFNKNRYIRNLKNLPEEPEERHENCHLEISVSATEISRWQFFFWSRNLGS